MPAQSKYANPWPLVTWSILSATIIWVVGGAYWDGARIPRLSLKEIAVAPWHFLSTMFNHSDFGDLFSFWSAVAAIAAAAAAYMAHERTKQKDVLEEAKLSLVKARWERDDDTEYAGRLVLNIHNGGKFAAQSILFETTFEDQVSHDTINLIDVQRTRKEEIFPGTADHGIRIRKNLWDKVCRAQSVVWLSVRVAYTDAFSGRTNTANYDGIISFSDPSNRQSSQTITIDKHGEDGMLSKHHHNKPFRQPAAVENLKDH